MSRIARSRRIIPVLIASSALTIIGIVVGIGALTPSPIRSGTGDGETPLQDNGGSLSIAFVNPLFTFTAYNDAFYRFYELHSDTPYGQDVTDDLELLKPKIIDHEPRLVRSIGKLLSHVEELSPSTNITIYTDIDVHGYNEGDNMLLHGNQGRMYDVVILGHQEYVTQQEYDNFKEYVANGGTLVALDGNVFYAEVKYDRESDTLQLVKGHDWEFDGNAARKSVSERWSNETSEWLGSNYLCTTCTVTFENNPFGYGHREEQYVTNPNAKIILDYKARMEEPRYAQLNPVIATYQMNYGKGQVIVLGIFAEQVAGDEKFQEFFDELISDYSGKKYP